VNCTHNMLVDNEIVIYQLIYATLNSARIDCICNCHNNSLDYTVSLIRSYCTDIFAPVRTIVG